MTNSFISFLNWGIAKDEALHQALKSLAGKRVRLVLPLFLTSGGSLDFEIEADGLLRELGMQTIFSSSDRKPESDKSASPHVTIIVNSDISKGLRIEGDALAAERLGPLVQLIKSRVSPLEKLWKDSPLSQFARQAADYAANESGVVVGRAQADAHHQALREFRDSLDRLEKRIDQLAGTKAL